MGRVPCLESLWQEPEAHLGSTDVLPQLGLTASVLLAFLCSLCGVEAWCGGGFSRVLVGFGVGLFCFSVVEQARAGLLWGCWVLVGVSSPVLPASLLHLVWFGKWLTDLFTPFGIKQSLCVGWAAVLAPGGAWLLFAGRRERGGSCCAPEGLWQRSCVGFPPEIRSAVGLLS